jgi:hypothetical protein
MLQKVFFAVGLEMSGNGKNKKWFIVTVIVLVCFAFSPRQAGAGTEWLEKQKLLAPDGHGYFGYSVSISGDYAIVVAMPYSAYIFKRDETSWSQQQELLPSGAGGTVFSVSISGDYAIAGAAYDDVNGSNSGSAYIFKCDGASWSQQVKLTASDGAAGDHFGWSVSISGDYAIVGAYGDDSNKGSAYIFEKFCPRADLDDDCKVDFADFAIFADWWLYGTD